MRKTYNKATFRRAREDQNYSSFNPKKSPIEKLYGSLDAIIEKVKTKHFIYYA